jgi:hypothetical protein
MVNVSVRLTVSAALPPVQVTVPLQPDSDEVQFSPPSSASDTTFERLWFAVTVVAWSGMLGQSALAPLCVTK